MSTTMTTLVGSSTASCPARIPPPDAYAPGGYVGDGFILLKIRALVATLTRRAAADTQIRCGSYSFLRGVLELLRSDPRLQLPPHRGDPFPFRLADAVCERDFARVKELRS